MGDLVRYPSNGRSSEGYLAVPRGGPGPGVLVIQGRGGLVPHIREIADRLADAGFVAFAPDLYHGAHTSDPEEAGKLLTALAMDEAAQDISGAADLLADRPEVRGRIGAVGFGPGGSLALWSGTLSGKIVATVAFYPALPWERMSPQWSHYAGKATVIHCDEADGGSAAPGGEVRLYDYPGTHYAFFNDDRPEAYDAWAAGTAWARTLELFRTRLA